MANEIRTLSVDLDGTIARFYDDEDYLIKMNEPKHFLKLRAYDHLVSAIRMILEQTDIKVIFNTAYPVLNPGAKEDKKKWLKKLFPGMHYGLILLPAPADKAAAFEEYMGRKLTKTDFLLDDYSKNLKDWEKAGGSGIKCVIEIQDATDSSSYEGPRINPNDDGEFLFKTLRRLILVETQDVIMRITYVMKGIGEVMMDTYGPIMREAYGYLVIPIIGSNEHRTIHPSDILSIRLITQYKPCDCCKTKGKA